MAKIPQYLLNLAGEYRICSELNKRGVFATITYGNRKSADVYAISDRRERALKIEVKTSQQGSFVTKIGQKGLIDDPTAPDFWVLFQIRAGKDGSLGERFFVLSHKEICAIQQARNQRYSDAYLKRHGKRPDPLKGVDNVTADDVKDHEGRWEIIVDRIGGPASG